MIAVAGDRTRVVRVTGGNTHHYTTTTRWEVFTTISSSLGNKVDCYPTQAQKFTIMPLSKGTTFHCGKDLTPKQRVGVVESNSGSHSEAESDTRVSWIIDIGGLAKKVKNNTVPLSDQIKDSGAYCECPKCHYHIDHSDVSPEWPGFPAGVKFDPSDVELLEHLAAKCCVGNKEPHVFIKDFIPTIEGDHGICYTHPENLPGAKKDGASVHFFHKTANAYATGQRKRRKINHEEGLSEEHVRWHKTGKTKAITENGVHKGFKKILVLYIRPKRGSKPNKSEWVMHQYHLGSEEGEKEGEYVVSKIFYQKKKQTKKNKQNPSVAEDSVMALQASPRTPNPNPPKRPRTGKYADCDDNFDETDLISSTQDGKPTIYGESHAAPPPSEVHGDDNNGGFNNTTWLSVESQLKCKEQTLDSSSANLNDSDLKSNNLKGFACNANANANANESELFGNVNDLPDFDLPDYLRLDHLPDFDLPNLQSCSEESFLQWLNIPECCLLNQVVFDTNNA
ncbi:hypothetical protein PIB30_030875 [Stylosanthes scabra]|uniref:NAC domain-containing protein n=1 Tax=Stylosanthes scabra TaxID=79078 RepID=A0ABU6WDS4_9FABA|nr:hypothetical protein [Stylosanthes scabra]